MKNQIKQRMKNLEMEYNKIENILIVDHNITEAKEQMLLNMLDTIMNTIAVLSHQLKSI